MKKNICIIGQGYVGLPLALEFSKFFDVLGFDENQNRINELRNNVDINNQVTNNFLKKTKIRFSSVEKDLKDRNIFIVTVPTPIKKNKLPDLKPLLKATKTISKYSQPIDPYELIFLKLFFKI